MKPGACAVHTLSALFGLSRPVSVEIGIYRLKTREETTSAMGAVLGLCSMASWVRNGFFFIDELLLGRFNKPLTAH